MKEAKRINPNVIVLILTGYGALSSATEAMRLGASDYLLKPCDRNELRHKIASHCDKIHMQQDILRYAHELETANEEEYKLAVIEADGILNDILLRMGFRGETLGDRLKTLTTAIIPNLLEVERAHQTRNNVVHDPDFRLTLEEAQKTIAIYEAVFSNLDLI